jgi:hypothetical protein
MHGSASAGRCVFVACVAQGTLKNGRRSVRRHFVSIANRRLNVSYKTFALCGFHVLYLSRF